MRSSAVTSPKMKPLYLIGKTRKIAKVLHRESDGLTLYVRKLSEGRFQMPHFNDDNRTTTLTPDEFTLLILGEKWYEETPSKS